MKSSIFILCVVIALAYGESVEKEPVAKPLPANHLFRRLENKQGTFANVGGREYFFSEYTLLTWSDAQGKCANLNMTLISLETIAETTAIFDFIATGTVENIWYWSSGHRHADNSWWWAQWNTEQSFNELSWGTGQPSTPPGGPDCTSFAQFFHGWDDDECGGFLMSYACEQRT